MNYLYVFIVIIVLYEISWRLLGWLFLALRLEIHWRINSDFPYDSPRYKWVMRDFGFMMFHTWRLRYKLINPENLPESNVVLYGNHISSFDPGIILYEFRHTTITAIAKKELFTIPVFGKWLKNRNIIPMDRQNVRKDAESIVKAIRCAKNGQPMIIFPEGTLSRDGHLLPFRDGAFKVALKSKQPICVFRITGTNEHRWYHLRRKLCTVEFFPVIPYEVFKDMSTNEIGEMVKDVILTGTSDKLKAKEL